MVSTNVDDAPCGDVDGRVMVPVSLSNLPTVGDVSGEVALYPVQSSQGRG